MVSSWLLVTVQVEVCCAGKLVFLVAMLRLCCRLSE